MNSLVRSLSPGPENNLGEIAPPWGILEGHGVLVERIPGSSSELLKAIFTRFAAIVETTTLTAGFRILCADLH